MAKRAKLVVSVFGGAIALLLVPAAYQAYLIHEEASRPVSVLNGTVVDEQGLAVANAVLLFEAEERRPLLPVPFLGWGYTTRAQHRVVTDANGRFTVHWRKDMLYLVSRNMPNFPRYREGHLWMYGFPKNGGNQTYQTRVTIRRATGEVL